MVRRVQVVGDVDLDYFVSKRRDPKKLLPILYMKMLYSITTLHHTSCTAIHKGISDFVGIVCSYAYSGFGQSFAKTKNMCYLILISMMSLYWRWPHFIRMTSHSKDTILLYEQLRFQSKAILVSTKLITERWHTYMHRLINDNSLVPYNEQ